MKAYLLKYTCKIITPNFKPIKTRFEEYFITRELLADYINFKNALSKGDIYYISKADKDHNTKSFKRIIPLNGSLTHINKYDITVNW